MKKIGVIGTGVVGKKLAVAFIRQGHEVMLGSRDMQKLADLEYILEGRGLTGSFKEAAAFGDILALAVKGSAAEEVINMIGAENLAGKTIIDTTNPIDDSQEPENGVYKYFTKQNESLMERLQSLAPDANFVKALNSIGNALLIDPDFRGIKPTMFICGNNDKAKQEVSEILNMFGWESSDMGKANAAGAIESLCILWSIPCLLEHDWSHAFKLLRQ